MPRSIYSRLFTAIYYSTLLVSDNAKIIFKKRTACTVGSIIIISALLKIQCLSEVKLSG